MPHDIFISHVEEDSGFALELAAALEQAGLVTWYYERDCYPGPAYLLQVAEAIDQASIVAVIISERSLGSNQVTSEIVRAYEGGKSFVPLLFGVSHAKFQQRQPVWRQALGASTSLALPTSELSSVFPRIVAGIRALLTAQVDSPGTERPHLSVTVGEIRKMTQDVQEAEKMGINIEEQIEVMRIVDPDDKMQKNILSDALDIYEHEERIPYEEKDSSGDIVRWLREVRDETRLGNCKLDDFFLVARTTTRALGMAYAHLYPSVEMAFFSYFVVLKSDSASVGHLTSESRVSNRLLDELSVQLMRTQKCKAVVTEVDEPDIINDEAPKKIAKARIKILRRLASRQNMLLYSIRIPYRQPILDIEDIDDPSAQEKPLRLMIVLPQTYVNGRIMARHQLREVLDFLAEFIYGDQYEDDDENDAKYRAYLKKWKEKLMEGVTGPIELY